MIHQNNLFTELEKANRLKRKKTFKKV